jgi:hypothetical protein
MDPEDLTNMANYMVTECEDTFFPQPTLVCSNTLPTSFVTAAQESGLPNYQLTTGCNQDVVMDYEAVTIDTNDCTVIGENTNIEIVQPITFASPIIYGATPTQNITMEPLFVLILSKLDSLLKCCPPCDFGPIYQDEIPTSDPAPNQQIYGQWTIASSIVNPSGGIDEVDIINLQVRTPIDTTLAVPDVGKYGRFWWIYDCNVVGEPIFINFQTQRFHAPGGNIIGFQYHLNYGISAGFGIKNSTRPGVSQF